MYTVNADFVHTFAGNPLDRGQHLRKDEAALQALQKASSSRVLPFLAEVALGVTIPQLQRLAAAC